MEREPTYDLTTGRGLMACPRCDALHVEEDLDLGETARCIRCGTVLAKPRDGAFAQLIALAFTSVVLLVGAVFFPFLEVSTMGFGNASSLFDVALAFAEGVLLPLVLAVLAMIIGLPILRSVLLLYTLVPLAQGRPPRRHAARAYRWSEILRPWSMAEIFVIGTAVALVKVAGLATVHLGPAFWAFCALIFVNLASRAFMCQTSIWDAIEDAGLQTEFGPRAPAAPQPLPRPEDA
ncbi:paraquat-inducible protein A [Paracoccus liaowanqingii]|uniref:Paraquat-inducible protein A n=2 Tax=Paracoccus liaowanqingii TaxID=2560053 RepID=A0A4P7HPK7_9RHOB|nr:paraquat-inducible protein A [Paracoccus liaowanqingii]QBX36255.1 paraquat-inducible protein A [Paracoccus liaowanqingii]TGN68706.1 paraquat-inducible protein A [Paracoccus liaowanqingii]